VSEVHTRAEIEATPMPRGAPRSLTILQRYRESFDAERSGDIFVAFRERASIGLPKKFGDSVAGNGSVWDHDRRVPILFWWPGAKGKMPADAAETVDIAPTLAAIAHVAAPPVDGTCIKAVAASACPQ
jgi:predicted AlkP superfamily pyrophosphatase or phosphodiesterase